MATGLRLSRHSITHSCTVLNMLWNYAYTDYACIMWNNIIGGLKAIAKFIKHA